MRRRSPAAALLLIVAGCAGPQRMLDARGPAAQQVATLWWVLLALAVLVSIAITTLLLLAIQKARRRARGAQVREVDGRKLVWVGGVIVPAVLLFTSLVYSFALSREVYPPRSMPADVLTIEVIGHQFWWEVRYPQHGILTANEFPIPAGQPVRLLVTSTDVIHSFWLPQLQGKIDLVPGRTHVWWLQADATGLFRGQCAEYCGLGHALMAFWVAGTEPAEFEAWLTRRSQPDATVADPAAEAGRHVFSRAGCAQCHSLGGRVPAAGQAVVGPDLRDLGTRRTLAAGRLANTRGNLAAWIEDPARLKPGARMPPTRLAAEDMDALLTFLLSPR